MIQVQMHTVLSALADHIEWCHRVRVMTASLCSVGNSPSSVWVAEFQMRTLPSSPAVQTVFWAVGTMQLVLVYVESEKRVI